MDELERLIGDNRKAAYQFIQKRVQIWRLRRSVVRLCGAVRDGSTKSVSKKLEDLSTRDCVVQEIRQVAERLVALFKST